MCEAISRIEDEDILIEVATESLDGKVAIEALEKITNQEFLKERALHAYTLDEMCEAISRIEDEDILIEVATESSDELVAIEAMKKLPKERIKEIKSKNWYVKAVCEDILSQ